MRKKYHQIMSVVIMLVLTVGIMSGCAGKGPTDEEIVVPKGEDSVNMAGGTQGDISGGISDQVQAPERYATEFSEGQVHVKADAPVIVPDGAGIKLYHVQGRAFTQEDYDKVNQVLLGGGQLWDRDYEAMEKSHGFVKAEIEERIARLKEQQEGNGESKIVATKEKTYDELISEWEDLLKEAPDEPVIVDIPAVVRYSEDPGEQEGNMLMGYVTVDQKDYSVALDNSLTKDWIWTQFEIRGPQNEGAFMPADQETVQNAGSNISADQVREEASALMTRMGFDDFSISGEEYVQLFSFDELTDEEKFLGTRYELHFTRMPDGIPVTYTHEMGTNVGDDELTWPYEMIDIFYTEEGLQKFLWTNPYQIEAAGDEYVFLLPFSDIQNVFEKMILNKAALWIQDDSMEIFYQIDEVRLGYMRVREKGTIEEGMMVPVWDFFGSETCVFSDGEQTDSRSGPYESLLTINAMDGTVIDRGLGY